MRNVDNIYIDETDVGRGVFAARDFEPWSPILTFDGPRVTGDHPVAVADEGGYLLQIDMDTYIVPRPPAVLVNHSCRPNAGIVEAVRLVAICPIRAGEEIRFDYSTTMDEEAWTMQCRCGAPSCRGVVKDFKYLPDEVKQRYLDLGIVSPFIADKY